MTEKEPAFDFLFVVLPLSPFFSLSLSLARARWKRITTPSQSAVGREATTSALLFANAVSSARHKEEEEEEKTNSSRRESHCFLFIVETYIDHFR